MCGILPPAGVRLTSGLKQAYIISHESEGGQGLEAGLEGVNICSEVTYSTIGGQGSPGMEGISLGRMLAARVPSSRAGTPGKLEADRS